MMLSAMLFLALTLVAGSAEAAAEYAVIIKCNDDRPVVFARCDTLENCDAMMSIYTGDGEAERFCGSTNWHLYAPGKPLPWGQVASPPEPSD